MNTGINIDQVVCKIKDLMITYPTIREELIVSNSLLRIHRLYESAKWSSELLLSINNQSSQDKGLSSGLIQRDNNLNSLFQRTDLTTRFNMTPVRENTYIEEDIPNRLNSLKKIHHEIKSSLDQGDLIDYGLTLYDLKEYAKCVYVLGSIANVNNQTAWFIYLMGSYLLANVSKDESSESRSTNKDLKLYHYSINKLIDSIQPYETQLNPFMSYMYATLLKEVNRKHEAMCFLIKALNILPAFWSAWVDLANLCTRQSMEELFERLEDSWMKYFFISNFLIEKGFEAKGIIIVKELLLCFPENTHLLNSLAYGEYLQLQYSSALEVYQHLFTIDPHRYEGLDIYSNILFIRENYTELSILAYNAHRTDKFRPESAIVTGNYYACKSDHHKAIKYFKRALDLDPFNIPAWTLLGHEYLELKEINHAVEAYRTATDIDPEDYRAWYALGQLYEIHMMPNYSLYYYLKASKSKPSDSRMWTAIASCYEKLERIDEALRCYEKALKLNDMENIALYKIGKLYLNVGNTEKASFYLEENLRTVPSELMESIQLFESRFFLGKYHISKGEYEKAFEYLNELRNHEGTEKEEIGNLLSVIDSNIIKIK